LPEDEDGLLCVDLLLLSLASLYSLASLLSLVGGALLRLRDADDGVDVDETIADE
jgi:hypothetical protein